MTLAAPTCCGPAMLGIEMSSLSGNCPTGVRYVVPVTNMGEHKCHCCESKIVSMIPMKDFHLEMVPLKSYLEQNKLPSCVKLALVNCKQ